MLIIRNNNSMITINPLLFKYYNLYEDILNNQVHMCMLFLDPQMIIHKLLNIY